MAARRSRSRPDNSNGSENTEFTNIFRNDGSFLEMFKKMQNASQSSGSDVSKLVTATPNEPPKYIKQEEKEQPVAVIAKPAPFVGRRRCTKALPVGKVKKLKTDEDGSKSKSTDPWAKYLDEVKKYKETYCDTETKNRSLVK